MSRLSHGCSRKLLINTMNEIKNLLNIAFVLLLFLTPLAGDDSFFNSEAKMLILVSILISGITLLDYDKLDARILFISIVILIVLAITVDPFKGLGAAFIYYVSISTFTKDLNTIIKYINILLLLNILFVILQQSGVSDYIYLHVNYSNDYSPVSIIDEVDIPAIYLTQFRPSGIFPTTTYMNYFSILLCSFMLYLKKDASKLMLSLVGILCMLIGSTMGLVMALILLIYGFKDRILLIAPISYILTSLIYMHYFNNFFLYNFSVADLNGSIFERNMDESIISQNLYLFILFALIFISIVIFVEYKYGLKFIIKMSPAILIIFLPMILHNFSESLLAYLFYGYGTAMITSILLKEKSFSGEKC